MDFCWFCRGLCRNPIKVGAAVLCGAIALAQVVTGDAPDVPGRALGNVLSLASGSVATSTATSFTLIASSDLVVYNETTDEEAARVPGGAMKPTRAIIELAPRGVQIKLRST